MPGSKRNNIIIRGVTESEREIKTDCEDKAREFFKTALKIDEDVVNNMKFVRCHRIGGFEKKQKKNSTYQTPRPLIVRFYNYSDKSLIWNAKGKISDGHVSISENFSFGTEYNRKKLYPIYKKAKNMDEYRLKVSLTGDVLVIDSVRYTVDTLHNLPDVLNPRQFSERSNVEFLIFGGIHSDVNPFSNWSPSVIRYKGHTFQNLEQAYQYAKATYVKDEETAAKLLYTTSPRMAKELGSKVNGITGSNWNKDRDGIMKELVKIKFTDNAELKKELLGTGTKILAESGHDDHYAIGLPISSRDIFIKNKWFGKNKLGGILCDIRESLK